MKKLLIVFLVLYLVVIKSAVGWVDVQDNRTDSSIYDIGVGIHDATGPAYGVNMMGYAKSTQNSRGIHMRLYSRAFIFGDGIRRLVFVTVDSAMIGALLKMKLVERLKETYDTLYTDENVILSCTHTHSAPAGFQQYLLYDISSLGFVKETFTAMLEGIYKSIEKAHNNMRKGYIFVSSGNLVDASINRSPSAYNNNPEKERQKYEHNTDKTMTLLRMMDVNGKDLGTVNWFATHATSMNNTNPLISGDNKGYASQLFEQKMNNGTLPGEGSFVAAFSQANSGDASPNTDGPKCQDTGLPCDTLTSTCNNRSQLCYASGPGKDMMESTKIIGEKQFEKAWELYHNKSSAVKLSGPVQYRMQYINMANFTFALPKGLIVKTCEPALGYSFAAGTTDGPGALDFKQGTMNHNSFWNFILSFLSSTRPEAKTCHAPKPILLDTGNYKYPYAWHPRTVDTQLGRIGNLFILAVPGEVTTMAGRRMKDKIIQSASDNGLNDAIPVIAGLSNVYTHYITTIEEYQIQRYEGASTIYGPNTHEAYMYQYSFLLNSMANGTILGKGPLPPDMYDEQISFLPAHLYDSPYNMQKFGDVVTQPQSIVHKGETQVASFVGGSPRNNPRLGGTFLTVEKKINGTQWKIIATDSSWDTRFTFETKSMIMGTGVATIYWDIPTNTPNGIYRIKHFGNWKSFLTGKIEEYEGITLEFSVEDLL